LKGQIQSVGISYLLHSTEDPSKVNAAIAELVLTIVDPELEEMQGHHGNKILRANLHLTGKEASKAFETIMERLGDSLRRELLEDIGVNIDEHGAFFLRLDKQGLVSGSLLFGTSDPVRVKVKPRGFLIRGGAAEFYSKLIGGN
jgi:RNA binding exosome subunit